MTLFFFSSFAIAAFSTLSLHDALPIFEEVSLGFGQQRQRGAAPRLRGELSALDSDGQDRKSTRLNSSHRCISYAVFCLKKKRKHSSANTRKYVTALALQLSYRVLR